MKFGSTQDAIIVWTVMPEVMGVEWEMPPNEAGGRPRPGQIRHDVIQHRGAAINRGASEHRMQLIWIVEIAGDDALGAWEFWTVPLLLG